MLVDLLETGGWSGTLRLREGLGVINPWVLSMNAENNAIPDFCHIWQYSGMAIVIQNIAVCLQITIYIVKFFYKSNSIKKYISLILVDRPSIRLSVRLSVCPAKSPLHPKGLSDAAKRCWPPQELERSPRRIYYARPSRGALVFLSL